MGLNALQRRTANLALNAVVPVFPFSETAGNITMAALNVKVDLMVKGKGKAKQVCVCVCVCVNARARVYGSDGGGVVAGHIRIICLGCGVGCWRASPVFLCYIFHVVVFLLTLVTCV